MEESAAVIRDESVVLATSESENEPVKDETKDQKTSEGNSTRKRTFDDMDEACRDVDQDREDGLLCPVCLDAWTSAGPHKLCSLKCGHLFGLSCVIRWLGGRQRGCPTCNAIAKKSDIREIYASKLVALDTSELESLRLQCSKQQAEIKELHTKLNLQVAIATFYREQCEKAPQESMCSTKPASASSHQPIHPRVISTIRLDEGICRVMAYNVARDVVAVSQEHLGPLWPGFGVRLLAASTTQLSAHHPLHKKELRDLCFHPTNPDLLLSVAFDNCVKVLDLTSNKAVFSWTAVNRVWSCCWDSIQSTFAYIGTERGQVVRVDALGGTVACELPLPSDVVKPVAVIALRSSRRLSCLLCCRLLSLSAYIQEGADTFRFQLLQEGKFSAMSCSEEEGLDVTLVLTNKPHSDSKRVRHQCFKVEVEEGAIKCQLLHVFIEGDQCSQLSRTSLLSTPMGLLYFAFNEANSTVCAWYMGQDTKVVSIKTHNFVRDLMTVKRDKKLLLFILNPNLLKCYELL